MYRIIYTARNMAMLALLALAVVGCEKPSKEKPSASESGPAVADSKPAAVEFVATPVERTVVDHQGRSLEVKILGRSGTHARVIRQADGMMFDLLIRDLSESDQRFINRILESHYLAPITSPRTPAAKQEKSQVPPYILTRQDSIARLEIKLKEQQAQLEELSTTSSSGRDTPRMRMVQRNIDQTNAEIVRLQGQINAHRDRDKE